AIDSTPGHPIPGTSAIQCRRPCEPRGQRPYRSQNIDNRGRIRVYATRPTAIMATSQPLSGGALAPVLGTVEEPAGTQQDAERFSEQELRILMHSMPG